MPSLRRRAKSSISSAGLDWAVDGVVELDDAVFAAGDAIAKSEGFAGGGAAVGFFAGEFAHAGVEEPGSLEERISSLRRRGRG